MIQAQIQLYLTKEGQGVFTDWLRFFGRVVKQYKGFTNIQLLHVERSASSSMVVIFDKKENMDAFFDSKVFRQLMKHMEVHSMHPYRMIVYRAKNMYRYSKQLKPKTPAASSVKSSGSGQTESKSIASAKSDQSPELAQPQVEAPTPEQAEKAKLDAQPATEKVPVEITENEQGDINMVGLASFMRSRQASGKVH